MPSITASALGWASPEGRAVLSGIDLQLGRERVGLVGRNGVGKTTLLHLLSGERQPTSGKITLDGHLHLMRQALATDPQASIATLFGVAPALAVLRRADAGLATLEEMGDADWTLETRIEEALARVGLDASGETLLADLSGGQRTRAGLAAAIFAAPDFLFLDEPTNNLDREGCAALIALVESWNAGLLVVSHDRELLERMDAILELTTLGLTRYGGNWSQYRARKAVELQAAQDDLAHARKHQGEIERRARLATERQQKRDAAGSRKAARGDMPRIVMGLRKNAAEASSGSGARLSERLAAQAGDAVAAARERIEVLQQLSITLPSSGLYAERDVLTMTGVTAGYDPAHPVLNNIDLTITGPQRIAITGPNGMGKSTLLRLISGDLAPLAGRVAVHVPCAIIDQHVGFLDPALSILDNFRALNPDANENACRAILAGFLFRADAALQSVGTLSGGQMLRAGLACRLGGTHPPALLVLDEPTNHLDLDSIQAVEAALAAYDGALLVVSHDEAFLDAIGIARHLRLQPTGDGPATLTEEQSR